MQNKRFDKGRIRLFDPMDSELAANYKTSAHVANEEQVSGKISSSV